jgi:hypothetical protein
MPWLHSSIEHRRRARLLIKKAMIELDPDHQRRMRELATAHVWLAMKQEREAASAARPTLH